MAARSLFDRYGYRRIELPIFEHTEVFDRSVGQGSDIVVQKQMYTFTDPRGRSLTLRPDGTAGTVRAFVEHRLDGSMPMPVRLWYFCPFFRYERPQQGIDRQFFQVGVECIGTASPVADAEVIALGVQFFESLGLQPHLLLNSIGCPEDRQRYIPALREALGDRIEDLCDDCHRRLGSNPLRMFDCKVAADRRIMRGDEIPRISEFLCDACKEHHAALQRILEALGVPWKDAVDLVRGLDYYTRTVFEFDLPSLGTRTSLGGGGRYDGLVEELGGSPTPALGFAMGVTRILEALRGSKDPAGWRPDVYVIWLEGLAEVATAAAIDLRRAGLRVVCADEAKSLRAQLRVADRMGAVRAVILGPDEVQRGVATIRDMTTGDQREVALSGLVEDLS